MFRKTQLCIYKGLTGKSPTVHYNDFIAVQREKRLFFLPGSHTKILPHDKSLTEKTSKKCRPLGYKKYRMYLGVDIII